MNDLKTNRSKLDIIDKNMKELFLQRMEIVKEIKEYKIKNNIEVTDNKREQEMIFNLSKDIEIEYKDFYIDFLKSVINISKEYQKKDTLN